MNLPSITGIKVDAAKEVKNTKRIASPDLWELSRYNIITKSLISLYTYDTSSLRLLNQQISFLLLVYVIIIDYLFFLLLLRHILISLEIIRLKYFGKTDVLPRDLQELEEVNAAEEVEDLDVELKEDEPTFLKGQTIRAGVNLSPVRVVKNPEGSLQREIMHAMQFAKERREVREQQQKQIMENLPREFNKYWDDPTADPNKRALVSALKGIDPSVSFNTQNLQ